MAHVIANVGPLRDAAARQGHRACRCACTGTGVFLPVAAIKRLYIQMHLPSCHRMQGTLEAAEPEKPTMLRYVAMRKERKSTCWCKFVSIPEKSQTWIVVHSVSWRLWLQCGNLPYWNFSMCFRMRVMSARRRSTHANDVTMVGGGWGQFSSRGQEFVPQTAAGTRSIHAALCAEPLGVAIAFSNSHRRVLCTEGH